MAKKYLLYGGLLVLSVLSYESCGNSSTGPETGLEFLDFSTSNPVSLLGFLGIDLNNLESYFLVDWTLAVDFDTGTRSPFRRLFARGFQPNQSVESFQFIGLDMGTVSFVPAANDSTLTPINLSRNFSPAAGYVYFSLNPPAPGAPRFIPGDPLRFTRSGAGDFAELTIDLTAPSDSICFTGPLLTNTLDTDQDLRVTWRGGSIAESILLTFQPVVQFSNGQGFLSGIYDLFQDNPREFTLPQTQLQELLDNADDELIRTGDPEAIVSGIFVYAAQPVNSSGYS